ncbi:efflux RND transporter permease subunit [Desulfobacterota bacterium AH_259_B03_O07]|nr:efflux RND transporter permease subunit [Desulfobacterota bacterium AH_259_B03_O07]
MRLIRGALENPYAVIVLAITIIVVGITVLTRIPVDILPMFNTPAVQVVTFYPGMPAEIVEKDITTRLERWTGQSVGISRQESKSMIGVSIVKDFFRPDIDLSTAMSQVSSYAMSDLFYLPPGTIPPMVMPFDPTATIPLAIISASSPTFDETKLYDVAYFDLRNRLQGISGVIAPAVYGGKLRRILAYVDRDKLQARGLSPMDVVETLRSNNVFIPTGNAKFGDFDYQINANGMVPEVEQLNDFPIKISDGAPVFLKDVGKVEDSHQIQTNIVRVNGRNQVYIPIYRQPGSNTIQIVEGVKDEISTILERLPKGINLDVVMDQSVYVRDAIRNLIQEGILGAILASIMILIFLGSVRSTVVVLISLPLSILSAFIGLYFTGKSINAMTLGGIALAVGLLIDQSVVVIENIFRHLEMGKEPRRAALDGATEVAKPLLSISLTIVVVFFPIVFITGIGKFLFSPLALSVAFAIGSSFILSIVLIPICGARFLKKIIGKDVKDRENKESIFSYFNRGFVTLRERYLKFLVNAIENRKRVLVITLIIFVSSLALYPLIGKELFPAVDSGQLVIRVRAQSGTRLEKTEELVKQIEAVIKKQIPENDLKMMISNIGVLLDWPAAYTPNSGPQDAFINLQFSEKRKKTAQEYANNLRKELKSKFTGVEFAFDTGGLITSALNFGLPSPIDIQVEGNDLGVSYKIAEKIKKIVDSVPGTTDVRIQQKLDYPQIEINVDRVKAAYLNLTQEDVVKNIVTTINSSINFNPAFWIDHRNGNHYFLGAQYREEEINSLDTLKNIPITGSNNGDHNGGPVLLKNIASFERTTAPSEINHLNISRVIDVFSNVSGRDIGSVVTDIEKKLRDLDVPSGYFVHMRGEVQSMRESFGSMGFGLILAIVLVYLVMVVQFRSFRDPLIVMFAIPLGLIGVLIMLFLTGTNLNIQSIMGIIMMVGIVVAFGILLVDFINRLIDEGLDLKDAVLKAAGIRLRPILMTALAAVLGLTPMALFGGVNIPLARAVIGGVIASTVLTLVVVPILYIMFKGKEMEASDNI